MTAFIRSFAPKDPEEVDFWEITFDDRMPPDDSIAGIVTVFVVDGDGSFTVDQFAFAGKSVSGRWQGGTVDATYLITARITTAQGRTLDKSGKVLVVDT